MSARYELPHELPLPEDDGRADHLMGMTLPSIALPATTGDTIDVSRHDARSRPGWRPSPGQPEVPSERDNTDRLPRKLAGGARGSTPT